MSLKCDTFSKEIIARSSGKNQFAYFPYICHLFEVRESNLMELDLSELTLTQI
jgi:hypothetical protein